MAEVLNNDAEDIFDGLVIKTPAGLRFVDAPEIARLTNERVQLTLSAGEVDALPEHDPKGAPEFRADPTSKRGRLWRKR